MSTIHRALDVRIFYKECVTLSQAGYEVHLLVANPPETQLDGVYFHPIDKVKELPRLVRIWRRLASTYQKAQSLQGNIYHFHDPELIPVGILLKFLGNKVIYDVHEDTPWEALSLHKNNPIIAWLKFLIWTVMEGIAKLTLDGFICVTPHIAAKFPSAKTTVVANLPLTVELQTAVNQTKADTSENYIIYAGGITEIRGIKEMVGAMELLPTSLRGKLLLLGEFSSVNLQTQIEQMAGWEKVEFLGWQPREKLVQYLGKAQVGLVVFHPQTDHLAALPNKLFEYMAAGLPIIASNFPLWQEIIQKIGCGLLVNPLEPQEIAQAMAYFLENPDMALAMGEKGQVAVKTKYNWEIESQKLLQFYQQIINQ
ncbi:glycosyltransferase [Calothrix sp. 336/3]